MGGVSELDNGVSTFFKTGCGRERERVLGSALFGMVKRNYKDNATQKAKA